jgi:hypothetical protein
MRIIYRQPFGWNREMHELMDNAALVDNMCDGATGQESERSEPLNHVKVS